MEISNWNKWIESRVDEMDSKRYGKPQIYSFFCVLVLLCVHQYYLHSLEWDLQFIYVETFYSRDQFFLNPLIYIKIQLNSVIKFSIQNFPHLEFHSMRTDFVIFICRNIQMCKYSIAEFRYTERKAAWKGTELAWSIKRISFSGNITVPIYHIQHERYAEWGSQ